MKKYKELTEEQKREYDRMTKDCEQTSIFGRVYGYARISTMKQNIERQIRNIKKEYPDAIIVSEEYTGTKMNRPGWTKIEKNVKEGDTVVFDSVSRMSRNADEGFAIYQELFEKGVNLVFLKERHIDTATYKKAIEGQTHVDIHSGDSKTDELISDVMTAFNKFFLAMKREEIRIAFDQAQKEVDDLHQRTKEGIETARLNGKQIGLLPGTKLTTKKSIEMKKQIRKYSKEFQGTLNDSEVMQMTGLSRNTFYKYKRELKSEY